MIVVDFEQEYARRRMNWTACRDQMPEVGLVVRIRCADTLGAYDVPGRAYLHDDGRWYAIEPAPALIEAQVVQWVVG